MLKEYSKESETAKLHFELWNMKKNMKDKSESVHKELSARLFKNFTKNTKRRIQNFHKITLLISNVNYTQYC